MRWFIILLSIFLASVVGFGPVNAAPTTADVAAIEGPLAIPFDPPTDRSLRYRWQEVKEKDGKSERSWQIYDAKFAKSAGGFKLTITPIDNGDDGDKSQAQKAVEKRLADLMRKPYVVDLAKDGSIRAIVDEDKYFREIVEAFQAALAESRDETDRKALQFGVTMIQGLSPEARHNLMIEHIQPLVEFASTDFEEAADILQFDFEAESLFNSKLPMDGTISVLGADDDVAVFSIVSRLAPEGAKKATAELLAKLAPELATSASAKMNAAIAGMRFDHETRSEYAVSRHDGTLINFTSSEKINVEAEGKTERRITTKSLTLVD